MKAKDLNQKPFKSKSGNEELLKKNQFELYSIKDIMSLFSVTRRTVSNWQVSGRLSYIKIGSLLYVTAEQLSTFLNDNTIVGYKTFGRACHE